jgi:hypothetical protein
MSAPQIPSAAQDAADAAFGPSPLDPPDDMLGVLQAACDPALGDQRLIPVRDVIETIRTITDWPVSREAMIELFIV